jgi:hypothetical protein
MYAHKTKYSQWIVYFRGFPSMGSHGLSRLAGKASKWAECSNYVE